ncbi:ribonuclease Y isoform X1 [Vitis riparia]|uniref:ribonuclease Y isoform X1 n=1 Tax=Vitis riparia TaxID=96939 RepID=UPI00155A4449|nr:ribonuclease Y isoform X1 [Vitis riparia]
MGSSLGKEKSSHKQERVRALAEKTRLIQGELQEMVYERKKQSMAYERETMVFALKEAQWKRERRRLREEVKRLKKRLEEKEERIRGMEDGLVGDKGEKGFQLLGTRLLVEHIWEERARRDEAVEKWKRLYLAIKAELDDLIQRTDQGERLNWKAEEEDSIEDLHRELKAKEETIEVLKARLASMEKEEVQREREVDILRQSLRIISNKKETKHSTKHFSRSLHL